MSTKETFVSLSSDTSVGHSIEPSLNAFIANHFIKYVTEQDLLFVETEQWTSDVQDLRVLDGQWVAHSVREGVEEGIFRTDSALVRIYNNQGNIWSHIAARSKEEISEANKRVREILPEYVDDKPGVVRVNFWTHTSEGPASFARKIEVPTWSDIRENYPAKVRESLDEMMTGFKPAHGGQLLLWEGLPGTGKTYSLRALALEWREWAKFHYITDPEEFFGRASYMFQVLLEGDRTMHYEREEKKPDKDQWNVLILEDCGELLSADAKQKTGQAVSRLLNVVDGLIGQGLKILVLVTTNEPVKEFHPAVARPGRTAAHVSYEKFDAQEADLWLQEQKLDPMEREFTLAELYAEANKYNNRMAKKKEKKIGFGT